MQRKLTYLFMVLMALSCLTASSQRKSKHRKNVLPERSVIARYEGGNRNVITLTLFSDSTFFYQEIGSQMGLKATKTGAYLLNDSTISLYTWRSYQFLRNLDEKVRSSNYRCNQQKILLYTKEQEASSDSSFYRSTFTLSRIE